MGDVLILAEVLFEGFGIPDSIRGGMGQMFGEHKLIGGARVFDAMGLDPRDLSWSGRFRGPTAVAFDQAMTALAASGAEVEASWGPYDFDVVVKSYDSDYHAFFEIPYSVTLGVIPSDWDTGGPLLSLGALVASDLAIALAGSFL